MGVKGLTGLWGGTTTVTMVSNPQEILISLQLNLMLETQTWNNLDCRSKAGAQREN